MKLLTLNTHSLQEENYLQKLKQFIDVILIEKPDIIAMQEVNQTITAPLAGQELLTGFYPCSNEKTALREDNHAANTAKLLREAGISCSWISSKIGYEKYDEGMALICLGEKIISTDSFYISKIQDYQNWKTRKVLGIQIANCNDWFFTVHMGWWQDKEEPFSEQWKRFFSNLQKKRNEAKNVWLMGDFNSPSEIRNQGYDLIKSDGWYDTYSISEEKDNGFTVKGSIDGWKTFSEDYKQVHDGMRIDHIWCCNQVNVKSSRVIFNGNNGPVVSDHFGVIIEI
ncbi:hypothetical protein M9Y10_028537 [Tritrichomonas musculus]|uniref:Endonuclease/exonuclease/phosphatase domain-containing protein n=1 Tax=Tritrichomonas musculus TaxID=1915356 RepID=A0ABR2KJL5_9EUKA